MNVRQTLICCFFLSLKQRHLLTADAQLLVFPWTEGEHVTVWCPFDEPKKSQFECQEPCRINDILIKTSAAESHSKFVCRDPCGTNDILIKTSAAESHSGRYSVEYESGSVFFHMSDVTNSDTGFYRCGLGSETPTYQQFEIIVTDAFLHDPYAETRIYKSSGANVTVECDFGDTGLVKYFCKNLCQRKSDVLISTSDEARLNGRYELRYSSFGSVIVSISQVTTSDSGRYRCSLDRGLHRDFELIVTEPSTATRSPESTTFRRQTTVTSTDMTLFISLTLIVTLVVFSFAALVVYRKSSSKNKNPVEKPDSSVAAEVDVSSFSNMA